MKKILLFFLIASIINSCAPCEDHTNPDCENYIPCLNNEKPLEVDFGMGGKIKLKATDLHGEIEEYYELDTVVSGIIRFWTSDESIVDRWKIDNKSYEGKEFTVTFSENYNNKSIEVQLSAYKYQACLNERDWRDTIRKSLYFKNENLSIYGNYEGAFENETETFTISINSTGIENFPISCNAKSSFYKFNDRFLIETQESTCAEYFGVGRMSDDRKELVIDFNIMEPSGITSKVFKGKKL